ncbi:hypothetical protein C8R47DRAFT_1312883 [Mycena vitilis]|nr:hypothetical protein C8R47DRAFT_1312883 [Mycena vitilis]
MNVLALLPGLVDLTISASEGPLRNSRTSRVSGGTRPYVLSRSRALPALNTVTVLFDAIIAQLLHLIIHDLATDPRARPPTCGCHDPIFEATPFIRRRRAPKFPDAIDRVQRLELDCVIFPAVVEEKITGMVPRVAKFCGAKSVAIKLEPVADLGDLPQWLAGPIVRTEFLQTIEVYGGQYPLVHRDT